MKKIRKNLLATFGALALVCVGAGAYNVANVTANAADSANDAKKLESMVLGDVSFRLTGDYGIRCDVTLDATDYADLTAANSGITTGVLVIPTDLLDGDLTLDTPYVGKGVTYDATNNVDKWVVTDDGTAETYAYIEDVPAMSYTRNLTFCAYYTVDGATEYTATKTTSLTYVAQSLLQEDAADDTTLTDELSGIVGDYVSDYTVVFQDGVTGDELSRTAVSANGGVEENTVTKPETDPTLFGGEFKGWYVGDKEWNFETDTITGDTLITAKYSAVETLDFTTATEVPDYLLNTVVKSTGKPRDGVSVSAETGLVVPSVYSVDYMQVSFLDTLTLSEYDMIEIIVKVITPNRNSATWMKAYANPTGTNTGTDIGGLTTGYLVDGVETGDGTTETYQTIKYTVGADGMSLKTIGFAGTQSSYSINYSIRSIQVIRYGDYIDFADYPSNLSSLTVCTSSSGAENTGITKTLVTQDVQENGLSSTALEIFTVSQYEDVSINLLKSIQLKKGDKVRVTLSACSAVWSNGAWAYTALEAGTIKTLGFHFGTSKSAGYQGVVTLQSGAFATTEFEVSADQEIDGFLFHGWGSYRVVLYLQSIEIVRA